MKRIINIGSLNLDKIYQLPHTPLPGETLTASSNRIGLGGKGLNQSIAAARAEAGRVAGPGPRYRDRTRADPGQ